jgi:hypothetical protein
MDGWTWHGLGVTLYQTLQEHYVALLGQRDSGVSAVVEELVKGNPRLPYLKYLPLVLPLDMDDTHEFKQIVIERLVAVTRGVLGDIALSQHISDGLSRSSAQGPDFRLRLTLDILGREAQTPHVVVILRTLNKVAEAPLKNLLLLLREYHDLIPVSGEAGNRLRFLVAGDEQLWRLCRHKESEAISPFNIAQLVFIDGQSSRDVRARGLAQSDDAARELVEFTGGVPVLVDRFTELDHEQADVRDPALYFPAIQPTWSGLLPETQAALCTAADRRTDFPPCIPDFQSPAIPDLRRPWSDAFWGGFLRLEHRVLTWRSPLHEAFVRHMADQARATYLTNAPLEERITYLEKVLNDPELLVARRQEIIALVRGAGDDDIVALLELEPQDEREIRERLQHLALHAYSRWQRAYYQVMASSSDDLQSVLLKGAIVAVKRWSRRFDVFLCYNSHERSQVHTIAEGLIARGMLPWLDIWEAPPGKLWQMILEEDIERCKATAVFIGQSGVGPWQNMEVYAVLDDFTRRHRPIIPVILPGTEQMPEIPLFLRPYTFADTGQTGGDIVQQIIDVVGER